MSLITTQEAAKKLNVSTIRIRQLIRNERLPAEKVGRDYIIKESDLRFVRSRKVGRPSKAFSNT